jgi:hypothetical protein
MMLWLQAAVAESPWSGGVARERRMQWRGSLHDLPVFLVQFSPVPVASFDTLDSEADAGGAETMGDRYRANLEGDAVEF